MTLLNIWAFIYLGSRIKKVSRFNDIWSKRSLDQPPRSHRTNDEN
jgi:hypothetical protein